MALSCVLRYLTADALTTTFSHRVSTNGGLRCCGWQIKLLKTCFMLTYERLFTNPIDFKFLRCQFAQDDADLSVDTFTLRACVLHLRAHEQEWVSLYFVIIFHLVLHFQLFILCTLIIVRPTAFEPFKHLLRPFCAWQTHRIMWVVQRKVLIGTFCRCLPTRGLFS